MSEQAQAPPGPGPRRRRVPRVALRVTLLYAVSAAAWIVASDSILGAIVHDPALVTALSILKGWLFVLVTGLLLYVLVSRGVRPIADSAEEYRGMFEGHPSIYLKVDGGGTILSVNPAGAEQLGYAPGELSGRSVLHLYADSDRQVVMEKIELLTSGSANVARWEAQAARKDGVLIWMKQSARAVQAAGGGRAILLVGEDVSEYRRSEATLGAAHESLRALFQASPLAIVALDRGGRVLSWNPASEAIFGWSEAEVLGRPIPIVPADLKEQFLANLGRSLTGEVLTHLELRRRKKDGTQVDVSLSTAPLRDTAGRIIGTMAVLDDISQRKEAERELGRLNRALRVLMECGQAVMRATTEDDLLRSVCRIAVEVGGYRLAWIGYAENDQARAVRPVAHAGFEDRYLDTVKITWADEEHGRGPTGTAIRTGRPMVVRNMGTDPTYGPWRHEAAQRGFASSIGLPLALGGLPFGALSIYADEPDAFDEEEVRLLTELADDVAFGIEALRTREERRRAEGELRQAQKMEAVGRLTGGIAHDFNNILTIIGGHSEILRAARLTDPALRRHLDTIIAAAEHADALTRRLLAFSRKQPFEPKVANLNAIVSDTERLLRRLLGEDIHLVIDLDPGLANVRVDVGQIEQVVVNLAINARDAMPDGGTLRIETSNVEVDENAARSTPGLAPGSCVRMTIADTGHGMDAGTRERIFEPFFTTKEDGRGTGLGLATVDRIVRQSAGHIGVRSEPGRGAAFEILLPAVAAPLEPTVVGEISRTPGGSETVLVVEDEPGIRALLAEILESGGYRVLAAGRGQDALDLLARSPGPVHLLLTDVVMPGMSGRDLADRLQPTRPGLKALFISGYTPEEVSRRGVVSSGSAFLQKPFSSEALLRKVRGVLDGP